jgi:hypothetical protein
LLGKLGKGPHEVRGGRLGVKLGKCHFMVKQGIVLGHVISKRGIEVDKAKVETVE